MRPKRRGKTNLVSIANVLKDSQKKTQSVFATSGLRKQWPAIVGEMLASQTRPKKIDRNMLWISVQNSALNYELSLMKPVILEKIREISGTKFKDVKFIHEAVDISKSSATEALGPKFIRAEVKEGESLETILENIKNLRKKIPD